MTEKKNKVTEQLAQIIEQVEMASTVAGVTIKTGIEDFVIKPFEQEVA